ncbi:hypothetical protein ANCCAN_23857 [Ancylostoma caninum]|uniref:Uncharacterized protein n=1 Tax=Ancylostoma caninum TaxID=29170 RepID=A0A368FHK2_ANCCA|nr:hypothetical protein ANCCAN_23857 [Ancylostoma caninum]
MKEAYITAKKKVPDMSVKKEKLHIRNELVLKPSIAAIKLGADLSDWEGIPVRDMLSEEEKAQYDRGEIKHGSLVLPGGVTLSTDTDDKELEGSGDRLDENAIVNNRKRIHDSPEDQQEPTIPKQPRINQKLTLLNC